MASPQKENGHTAIANEILDTLCKTRINGQDRQVLDFIFRKTYGWQKKRDRISLSQFEDGTGMKRARICDCIKNLINMKIIIKIQDDNGSTYEFNKNYDEWEVVPKQARASLGHDVVAPTPRGTHNNGVVPPVGRPIDEYRVVPQVGIGVVPQVGHTKENNTKETIQKKSNASVVFPKTLKSFRDQRRIEAGKPPMAPRPMTSAQKRAHTELVKIQPLIDRYKELASEKGLSYLEFPEETNQKLRRQFLNVIAKYGGEWNDFFEWIFTGKHRWAKQAQYNPESCLVGFMFDAYKNKDVENEINTNGFIS